MLWRIFRILEPTFIRLYRRMNYPSVPNLLGDRDIENSWIVAHMPEGPGSALDFGGGLGWFGLLAARKGFEVIAIDLQPVTWYYEHPSLNFIQGDLFKLNFPPEHFDLIISCSAVEHVGLCGRYGIEIENLNGDIEAMALLKEILKPKKPMLLTIPVGEDSIVAPLHRIYGEKRLPRLLMGWEILKKEYWIKDDLNRWVLTEESIAFRKKASKHCYGLGLFVLERPV
jgi:SAM-dependent methyltransferase